MKRPCQPLRGADDADIVPHETANLPPVMLDDDFLVAIRDTAFVPGPDRRGKRQAVPVGMDVPGRRFAEDKAFQQRIGCQAIRAMQAAFRHLPRCIEARQVRPPVQRSEEHTSELQSLMRISYAVFCLNKKKPYTYNRTNTRTTKNTIPSHTHR